MPEIAPPPAQTQRKSFLRLTWSAIRLILINFFVFAVLAELTCWVYINVTDWHSSKPTYHLNYNSFWEDTNRAFGVWHRPNGTFFHQGGCFSVVYHTNSYGARDIERSLHSSRPRTVVLGDSFIEGLGSPDKDRLTNILERDTGREHLNFGTAGDFGPLQYALLYKTLASKFYHNLVLVGVLPDNDFHDMSPSWGAKYHKGRYRPYYAPDYSIYYTGKYDPNAGESMSDHAEAFLRAYLASYHVGQYIWSHMFWTLAGPYSGYNDYRPVDLARLQHALEDIKSTADAHGAKVAVFLIPSVNDFERLQKQHQNRLGPVLESWGKAARIPVLDLLPGMEARSNGDFRSYFLSCDGHWTAKGAYAAASVLEPWLRANGED